MDRRIYIVVIHGYEGTECMFGTFTKSEAEELALHLKQEAPDRLEADQVCIMAGTGKNKRMECVCKRFPKVHALQKEVWLH